jgi:hypothetical protein
MCPIIDNKDSEKDMQMVEIPVEKYIKAVKCDCGGIYAKQVGYYIYDKDIWSTEAKANFKCNKCGKVIMLDEKHFPVVTYRIKDNC